MASRGPYAKGAAKREEIIATALEVVALHGCRKTYVREIAERVGLTPAGLMHHFSSREALFEAVLSARDERDELTFASEPLSLEDTFFAIVEHNREVPGLVQLYAEFVAEAGHPQHPSHAWFQARYERIRALVSRAIEEAQHRGDVGPALDPQSAARQLLAVADGLQVQWLLDPAVDMAAELRAVWRTMITASQAGG